MLKKFGFCLIILVTGFGLLAAPSWAVPSTMAYQGMLKDSSGNPLSGNYDMVFTIYDASSSGTNLWTETQTVSVESGLYNVQLGSSTALTTTVFNGDTRYLGIKVGTDNEMTPRVALVTVPYAFRAGVADSTPGDAGTVGGLSASDFVRFGPTNIQTTSNQYGISLESSHSSGQTIFAKASGTIGQAIYATSNTGNGVYGESSGASGQAGIFGNGLSTSIGGRFSSGANYAIYSVASGATGRAIYADASNTGASTNYGGYFEARGQTGRGVYGLASGTGSNYGGYFEANGTAATGVYGKITSTGYAGQFTTSAVPGICHALYATSYGTSGGASGVIGSAVDGGTLANYGGRFEAYGDEGRGVLGWAKHASGVNYGVYGQTNSSNGYSGYFTGGKGIKVVGTIEGTANLILSSPTVPATKNSPGTTGMIAYDGAYIYVCVLGGDPVGTWKRVTIEAW